MIIDILRLFPYIPCMASEVTWSAQDREFFHTVARVAFCNPFMEDYERIMRELAGMKMGGMEEVPPAAVAVVRRRIETLEEAGAADIRGYAENDRQSVRYAFLFDIVHRFADAFEAYIRNELASGNVNGPVPFARDVLNMLVARGFSDTEACGYLGLFYQWQRARHFVDQSMFGQAPMMKEFRRCLWDSVFSCDFHLYERFLWKRMADFPVLIVGETGTGKGAVASAIGRSCYIPFDDKKQRFIRSIAQTYVSVHLPRHSESRMESELFGHSNGAVFGAGNSQDGILARCCPHGTVFLDGMEVLPLNVQAQLLGVLQERAYTPLGGDREPRRFQGRIMASTNRSPEELRQEGRFHHALYYRLCSTVIRVPTLRDRIREDKKELDHVIAHIVQRQLGVAEPDMVTCICNALHKSLGPDYSWPGNIRELGQAVRRILVTGHYEGDKGGAATEDTTPEMRLIDGMRSGSFTAPELQAHYCALLYDRFGTYGEVARRTGLDWRTVKKYVDRKRREG